MIESGYLDVVSSSSPLPENRASFHQNLSLPNDHPLSPNLINFPRQEFIDTASLSCGSTKRDDNVNALYPPEDFMDSTVAMNLNDGMKNLDYNCNNGHVNSSGLVTPPNTRPISNSDSIIHQALPENADVLIAAKLTSSKSCLDEINGMDEVATKEVLNDANHEESATPFDSTQPANRSTLTTPVLSEHENSDLACIETQRSNLEGVHTVTSEYTVNTNAPIDNTHTLLLPVTNNVSPNHSSPNDPTKPDPKFPDSVEPPALPTTSPSEQPFTQHLSSSPASTSSPATSISLGIFNNNANQAVNVKSEPLMTPSPSTCDDAEYAAAAIAAVDSVVSALVGNKSPSAPSNFDPSLIGTGTDRLYSLSLAPPPRQSFEVYNNTYTTPQNHVVCSHPSLIPLILSDQLQPEYLTCPACQKTLSVKALLKQHRDEAVNEEAKHMCQTCGRSFVREDKLKRHIMSIHTMEKPHICHICTKAFSRKDKLKEHVKHHDRAARNFECAQCMSPFVQKSDLNRHIRGVHQGEPGVGINMTIRRKVPGSSPTRSSRKKRSLGSLNGSAMLSIPMNPSQSTADASKDALALRLFGANSTSCIGTTTTTTTSNSAFQMQQQQMAALHTHHQHHAHPLMMLPSAAAAYTAYAGQPHYAGHGHPQGQQFMALAAAAANHQQQQKLSTTTANASSVVSSSPMMVLTQIAANQAAAAAVATPASQQQQQHHQAQLSYQYQQQLLQHQRDQQAALAAAGGYTQQLIAHPLQGCAGADAAASLQEQQQHQCQQVQAYRQQVQAAAVAVVQQQQQRGAQYPIVSQQQQQQQAAAGAIAPHPQSAFLLPGTAAAAAAAASGTPGAGAPAFFCHPEMTGLILSTDPTTQLALAAAHMQVANSNHNGTAASAFAAQQPACALSGLQVVANVFGGHHQATAQQTAQQQQQLAAHQQQLYAASSSYQQQAEQHFQQQQQQQQQQQLQLLQHQQRLSASAAAASAVISTNQQATAVDTAHQQQQQQQHQQAQQLVVQDATATANYQLAAFTNAAAAALYQQQQQHQAQAHQQAQVQQGLVLAYQQQQQAAVVAAQQHHQHQQAVAMHQHLAVAAAAQQQAAAASAHHR